MTSPGPPGPPRGWRRRLRNASVNLRRLLRPRQPDRSRDLHGPAAAPRPPGAPRVDFSYTIYWTKQVRAWEAERRAAVHAALERVVAQPDFEANAYARRYTVPDLDGQAHAGASLLALRKVLAAFMTTDSPAHES